MDKRRFVTGTGVQGRLKRIVPLYQQLLQDAGSVASYLTGYVRMAYAELLYEWNDLSGALRILKPEQPTDQKEDEGMFISRYLIYVKIKQATGNIMAAFEWINELKRKLDKRQADRWLSFLVAFELRLRLKEENHQEEVENWLRHWGLHEEDELYPTKEYEYMTLVRVYLAQKEGKRALYLLERLKLLAEQEDRLKSKIETFMLQALVYEQNKDMFRAGKMLENALLLAEPEDYTFLLMIPNTLFTVFPGYRKNITQ